MLIFPLSINADRVLPNTCIISCNGRSLAVISVELLSAEAAIGAGRLVIAYVCIRRELVLRCPASYSPEVLGVMSLG